MTVHTKIIIKLKVFNQILWNWCYYNEEKMLYPAKWKKHNYWPQQSHKNRPFRFFFFFFWGGGGTLGIRALYFFIWSDLLFGTDLSNLHGVSDILGNSFVLAVSLYFHRCVHRSFRVDSCKVLRINQRQCWKKKKCVFIIIFILIQRIRLDLYLFPSDA